MYLIEENYILRRQLRGRRLRLSDDDRRRLAVHGHRLGRRGLCQVTSIVTPDTILRWHRQLVVRMAHENPTWGYTRIRGALKNVGHQVGRSTIARILEAHGIPPVPERPTSWQTYRLRDRSGFPSRAPRRLDTASRRGVHAPSRPHADGCGPGVPVGHHVLICDRDAKWSHAVRERLGEAGIRVVQAPYQAPYAKGEDSHCTSCVT